MPKKAGKEELQHTTMSGQDKRARQTKKSKWAKPEEHLTWEKHPKRQSKGEN